MDAPTEAPATKVASAPFDDQNADIVLRSSDKVDFRVYSLILSLASSFFKQAFTLPQPDPPRSDANLIDVAEDSIVLDKLLRCCYPGLEPVFKSAGELSPVIDAMAKYAMDNLFDRAKRILSGFSDNDPVRVFAISHRYGWKDMAVTAAKNTTSFRLPFAFVDELNHVPIKEYHTLVGYHSRCSNAVLGMFEGFGSMCDWVHDYPCEEHDINWYDDGGEGISDRRYWVQLYMSQMCAQLQARPSMNTFSNSQWIVDIALTEATACQICSKLAGQEFLPWVDTFRQLLQQKLDNVRPERFP